MSKLKTGGLAIAASLAFSLAAPYAIASPSVERLNKAFPESVDGVQSLMESASAVEPDEVSEFFILKGEKLREAMLRWTKTSGFELVWQPKPEDGDIRFAANMTFNDTFRNAANDFFKVVRSQTKFDGKLHGNGVLRVFVANAKR